MSRLKCIFPLLLLFTISTQISAQSTADASEASIISFELEEITDENWSFYKDEENNIYYIDFETISFNLSDVVVKNEHGEIIMKDDVLDLPVNTIYEIDFSEFSEGKYEIELRSFTGFIRKAVSIK